MSFVQVKMNLDTLLEAAKYLDLQEELKAKQRQNRQIETIGQPTTQSTHLPPPPPLQPRPVSPPHSLLKQELTSIPPPLTTATTSSSRVINNSFDIINPLVTDEGGEQKRKQPPLAFRAGTREVHNKLEKHRRAHLKECFDLLKRQLPTTADDKKASNLSILHSALCFIQTLKRKERDLEHEMERLAREKIAHQQRLVVLKKEVAAQYDGVDFSALLSDISTTTQQQHIVNETNINCEQELRNNIETSIINHEQKIPRPSTAPRPVVPIAVNGVKEGNQMQTALSVLPVGYPMSQGLVLQKVALVPKGLADLSPLVSTPTVAHFITAPQQIGGKVVPLVNAQYVVKPVVVVTTPSRPS